MRDHEPLDEDVRSLFRDARQLEPEPPTFQRLWQRAGRQHSRRSLGGFQLRRGLMATAAVALVLSLTWAWLGEVRAARQAAEADAVLADLEAVEPMPLDFLLEIPGAELMRQTPRIGQSPHFVDPSFYQLQEN